MYLLCLSAEKIDAMFFFAFGWKSLPAPNDMYDPTIIWPLYGAVETRSENMVNI